MNQPRIFFENGDEAGRDQSGAASRRRLSRMLKGIGKSVIGRIQINNILNSGSRPGIERFFGEIAVRVKDARIP